MHDLLVSKNGIALPKSHGLRLSIERYKTRLSAEFTRARIQAKAASLDQWKALLGAEEEDAVHDGPPKRPRWVRINSSLTGVKPADVLKEYKSITLSEVMQARPNPACFAYDTNIENLVAFPSGTDLTSTRLYESGQIILQDKASCFPATLLDPTADDGDIIDACAAPGNKTTHLAALLAQSHASRRQKPDQTIYAVERDKGRAITLQKMVNKARANHNGLVQCLPNQDFLRLDPTEERFSKVGAILLDPSCSGSGIVGRDDDTARDPPLILPERKSKASQAKSKTNKQRRSKSAETPAQAAPKDAEDQTEVEDEVDEPPVEARDLEDRLKKLSNFQTSMILQAMKFPRARKIVYSTCSVHVTENESVVGRVLKSKQAVDGGWTVLRREDQVEGLRQWHQRGDIDAVRQLLVANSEGKSLQQSLSAEELGDACIRCSKGTMDGTMGFFTVGFVRAAEELHSYFSHEDEEWEGFSDE